MIKKIVDFFDKFEDHIRGSLSHYPIIYTLIGSVAIVLFWRGVWHTADMLQARGGFWGYIFYEPVNMVVVSIVLLATGLFVSYFIGDSILLSGIKQQKKLNEKTEKDIGKEEETLVEIKHAIDDIKKEMDEIKEVVENEHLDKSNNVGKK